MADVLFDLQHLLVSKQNDYGPRAINDAPGGPLKGINVRLHDKLQRIVHLDQVRIAPENEAVRDSYRDLANYAVIALMVIDGTWPQ